MASATMSGPQPGEPCPIVETTEEVCVFLNGRMGPRVEAYKATGYFHFGGGPADGGVVVCAKGRRGEIARKLLQMDEGPAHGEWKSGPVKKAPAHPVPPQHDKTFGGVLEPKAEPKAKA